MHSDRNDAVGNARFHRLIAISPAVCLMAAVGCQGPRTHLAGVSLQGRPIQCQVFGTGDDVVFILATIHGNEGAGTPLVERLADHIASNPQLADARCVVLMPTANPDGHALGTRHNAGGVDLNRNFPAPNFTRTDAHGPVPLSEPESRAIKRILDEFRPARIVSIHQPLECIDYDGPGAELAQAMAAWTDLPVRRVGSLPGSLGSYAGLTLGVPIVTVELPASAGVLDEEALWQQYGDMLLAAIRFERRIE